MTSTDALVERILARYDTITVVGASRASFKAAHSVPAHMQGHGWRIIPVNPYADQILGERVYRTLADVPEQVGLVDVFRPSGQTPDIARQAVAAGATALWLQLGIASAEARAIAEDAGLLYVEDRCLIIEQRRLNLEAPIPEERLPRSGSSPSDTGVPPRVLALADGDPITPVWTNELGGMTFAIGAGGQRRFVKWAPAGSGLDLAAEAARLRWAVRYTPVPRLLGEGADSTGTWIVTRALPGQMAVADRWKAEPRTAVTAIGESLRALHEALPVRGCPFSWTASDRLADTRRRAARGLINPARWHPEHQHLDVPGALRLLAEIPPDDQLVVCHGDSCAPNTLLTDDGRWSGHVDLGELGVADRWADLAVATWSTIWNYGPGWELLLLEAYGVAPDPARTRFYRLLWDLGP